MAVISANDARTYVGLSSDSKPSAPTPGSLFVELDTGLEYVSDGALWYEKSARPRGRPNVLDVTLSLDTSAYGSGDVLAATQEIANAVMSAGSSTIFDMIQLLDEDDQGGALELLFFGSNIDIGAENAAYDLTDTELRSLLGWVEITAADYKDWGGQRTATVKRGDIGWRVDVLKPAAGTSLYVAGISRDTKTYTAAGIKLKLHALQD